jgi:hypothetical protein
MGQLTLIFVAIAAGCGAWLAVAVRARGGAIPCTERVVSVVPVVVGVLAIGAFAGGSGIAIARFHLFVPEPFLFTLFLGAMSLASVLFIVAFTTSHMNRIARLWITLAFPDGLLVQVPGGTRRIALAPGGVQAFLVGGGVGGRIVEYRFGEDERPLRLVVPYTFGWGLAPDGLPWLERASGLVVQGRARAIHRLLMPFCAPRG